MNSSNLEGAYVKDVYNLIAEHFDETRYNVWPSVKLFMDDLPPESNILDCGCGNGKNMYREDCTFIGLDNSVELLKIAQKKGRNVVEGDIRELPFEDNSFDSVISVAVIHHLATKEDRLKAINEMFRVCKPNGKIFIQVWADTAIKPNKFIPINEHGDYIVKWTSKDNQVYERYYHLFSEDEFRGMFDGHDGKVSNDYNNWIISINLADEC